VLFSFASPNPVTALWDANVGGPVPFSPFVIDAITVNVEAAAGAPGGLQANNWTLLVSGNPELSLAAFLSDQNIIVAGDSVAEGIRNAFMIISGQESQVVTYPVGYVSYQAPAFLKFLSVNSANATLRATVTVSQLTTVSTAQGPTFVPIIPRINLNANTAPPAPRSTEPPVPRGARISVTQGGRILSQRIVSWPALAPAIKAKYLEQQLGAPADPSIQWIL
jgi:hypothetical protein